MPAKSTSYLDIAAAEAERVLTHGRSAIYLVLGAAGTASALGDRHPLWWLVPALTLPFALSAWIPSVRLLIGKPLPRCQRYLAVAADATGTALLQMTVAAVAPESRDFAFAALLTLLTIVISGCGMRMDRRLVWAAFALCAALLAVFASTYPGAGRGFAFCFLAVAAGQAHLAVGVVRKSAERDALARFVSPNVARRILSDSEGLALGGAAVDATIMFTDLRGFTQLAESKPPLEVVALLNRIHALQVAAVFRQGGTVNKFTGDGLLAIFGAPEPHPESATAAARAALEIVEGMRSLASEGVPVRVGVGLHRGTVVAGNVGSAQHLEYTVIGDVVNVAARLESLTREHQVDIIASSAIVSHLDPQLFEFHSLGEAALKGRQRSVTIFSVRRAAMATLRLSSQAPSAPPSRRG